MKCFSVAFGLLSLVLPGAAAAADLDAVVQWARRLDMAVPVSGVVATVAVQPGEQIKRGQLLLALDETPFRAAVQEAEAQFTRSKVERDEAQRDAKQAQELYDRTVLSTVELDTARMKLTRATAGTQAAQAALERARYRLRVSQLHAPYDARVLSRHAEPGQSVSAELQSPVLLVIAASGEYLAQARVPADRTAGLQPGQVLSVTVGNKTYPAVVQSISYLPTAARNDPYLVDVVFTSADRLHAGQGARIRLP